MLKGLLDRVPATDPRVILGPRLGEDAALIDIGDRYLAAKTDPITFATDLIGWYVVQINCNDLAVMGATPRWLMVTLLLPEGTGDDAVEQIFSQITDAATEHGIALVGGHTEVTVNLPRPIAVGVLLGEVEKDDVVLTSGVQPGDALVLTKGIAIEGASVLAREAADDLRGAGVEETILTAAAGMLYDPGISVRRDAEVARGAVTVHAMHDPTEGGLASGLAEMATASGVGMTINQAAIRVHRECQTICDALGLDPMGLIASGALLVAVGPEDAPRLIDAFGADGIDAWVIGRATEPGEGLRLRVGRELSPLPTFERDELARHFG